MSDQDKQMQTAAELRGPIGDYARAWKSSDFNAMLKVVIDVIDVVRVVLPHPLRPEENTRCRSSLRSGMYNLLFFSSETNDSKWILCQQTSFADAIITTAGLIGITKVGSGQKIKEYNEKFLAGDYENQFIHNDEYGGLVLGQSKPFHFFYDQFINLPKLLAGRRHLTNYVARGAGMFLLPDGCLGIDSAEKKKQTYYFFPNVYGANERKKGDTASYYEDANHMEQAIASAYPRRTPESAYDLVLWIGITGQKRAWIEQVEGYAAIIHRLADQFPAMHVYVDGITAGDGKTSENLDDAAVVDQLTEKVGSRVILQSVVGLDYPRKIALCHSVDVFISNGGTGAFVPLRICKKPGVMHSNQTVWTFNYDSYPDTIACIKGDPVPVILENSKRHDYVSYSIDWREVYNRLVPIVNDVKNMRIAPVFIP